MDSFFISSDSSSDIFGIPDADGDSVSAPRIPSMPPSRYTIPVDVQLIDNWQISKLDTVLGRRVIMINASETAHFKIFVGDIQLVPGRPCGFVVPVGAYHSNLGKIDSTDGIFFRMSDQCDLHAGNENKITWRNLIRIVNPNCPDSGFELRPSGRNRYRDALWHCVTW